MARGLAGGGWVRAVGLTLALGCEPMPSSGRLWEPVRASPPAAPAALPAEAPEELVPGEAPVDAEGAPPEEEDPLKLQARLLQVDPGALSPAPAPAPAEVVAPSPAAAPAALPVVAWPAPPAEAAGFGPYVLAVLPGLQPPRAVLALANGSERVVKAGDLIPEAGLVVLAVGVDQVQLADVRSEGAYATVTTRTLRPLLSPAP